MSVDQRNENLNNQEACEERLLRIAENAFPKEASLLFLQKQDWDVIKAFHPQRENAVGWLPIRKTDRVLEIGAGCGAMTGKLCRMAAEVTALTFSETLAKALRIRHGDKENLTVISKGLSAFLSARKEGYDWVIVSDERKLFTEKPDMALLRKALVPGGKLMVGFYNPYGLMFLSGCADPESGRLFGGLEGSAAQESKAVISLRAVKEALEDSGFGRIQTYYPFPTHLMPNRIFSDDFLPTPGELKNDTYSFQYPRIRLFDEQKAWDRILSDGAFSQFSNSYFLIAEAAWSS